MCLTLEARARARQYGGVTSSQPQPAVSAAQAALRAASRRARAQREPDAAVARALLEQVRSIAAVCSAQTITGYLSMPGEPPTELLLAWAVDHGTTVLVPRIAPDRRLEWVRWRPDVAMAAGPRGIREPVGAACDLTAAQVLLVPAAAVDSHTGVRVGQGGGYYDRVLAGLPRAGTGGPLRIALVFDDEVHRDIPAHAWDERVDVVVTPTRVLPVEAAG